MKKKWVIVLLVVTFIAATMMGCNSKENATNKVNEALVTETATEETETAVIEESSSYLDDSYLCTCINYFNIYYIEF